MNEQHFISKVCVKWQRDIENAILGEIKQKAIDNGIKTEYVLNEKAIMNALEKQIPKKPKISRSTIGIMWGKEIKTKHFACPFCKSIFLFAKDEVKGNCCKFCGQALDWSDTK